MTYEMKKIKLQGKEYVQVAERLKYFRETYEDGKIITSYEVVADRIIFTAEVVISGELVATGTAMKNITKEFELEKAETRAIGRALAIAGIGLDAGIASYDEVKEAIGGRTPEEQKKDYEENHSTGAL